MNKNIAVILARGGSKGIPRKNIRYFCGLPLVAWSVIQAKISDEIDEVFISSDCDEILEIANSYGATKIKRPMKFADDFATSESAVGHAIEYLGSKNDTIIMMEPTAPLRKPTDLSDGLKLFKKESWDSAFSGAALQDFLIWRKANCGQLESVNYDYKNQGPRQLRQPDFVENGAIYMFKTSVLKKYNNRFGGKIGIVPNEFWQSFEIDEPDDWAFLELIFNHYLRSEYKKLGY
jgi:N-acylneuraminate cytidylyltransferase